MYNIYADNISGAHAKLCKCVIESGESVLTEDGAKTIELCEPIAAYVVNPFGFPMKNRNYPLSEAAIKEYIPMMCEAGNKNGHAYQYGDRLRAYPRCVIDGFEESFDQIEHIIHSLNDNSTSRRAIAHTWVVDSDANHKTPPCMQTVQFIRRGGSVNAVAYFRSNDLALAWGSNAYGLAHLLKYVADNTDSDVGYLQTISSCAHIYETDLEVARKIAYG
jgi:thymidylate synthase